VADLQRAVVVGAVSVLFGNEEMTRDGAHGSQNPGVANIAPAQLFVHHPQTAGGVLGVGYVFVPEGHNYSAFVIGKYTVITGSVPHKSRGGIRRLGGGGVWCPKNILTGQEKEVILVR